MSIWASSWVCGEDDNDNLDGFDDLAGGAIREDAVVAEIGGIPNTGGDW